MTIHEPDLLKQFIRRICLDLLITPFAFIMAWFVRFDFYIPADEWEMLTRQLLPITLVYIAINLVFGIYRRLWAYASFRDVILLVETVTGGTLMLVVSNFMLTGYRHYRLSTGGLLIGGLLTLTLSTVVKYRRQLIDIFFASWSPSNGSDSERVLIVGVNETAQQLATRMYIGKDEADYEVVGFVDDNPNGKGMSVNGVEILGTLDQIRTLVSSKQVDVIIIARRPPEREKMWKLIATCLETPAQVKVLPDVFDVIQGRYEDPLTLRDVSIDDILERTPATANAESCQRILTDQIVMVTGAAGSIGSELCRQILRFNPKLLVALDNNETGLYDLNLELNQDGQAPLELAIANVADWQRMKKVFQQYRPQIVFHVAAYKHVPLLERHPDEAIQVNVIGTVITSELAHEYEIERFVFVSTDKAVNPSSVMGASKRIGELWMKAMSKQSDTVFTTVRFGNVIGSRGSVLPTFTQQIESGGPVTVTDQRMHRFFISIPEAACLVLEAASFKKNGGVFMLEMGEEVSIYDLARRMIRLRGLRVQKDVEIKVTGMRPGEKLQEELAYGREIKEKTPHPRIYSLKSSNESADHDTFLGVILILSQNLRLSPENQHLRKGIFQIASGDIDDFLNQVTGVDLTRDWQQSPEGATLEDEELFSVHESHVLESTVSASKV